MNHATYLGDIAKARLDARDARDAADRQCVRDVCSLCARGLRPMPLADRAGYWHRVTDSELSDWPCRASGIHERRAREREANRG